MSLVKSWLKKKSSNRKHQASNGDSSIGQIILPSGAKCDLLTNEFSKGKKSNNGFTIASTTTTNGLLPSNDKNNQTVNFDKIKNVNSYSTMQHSNCSSKNGFVTVQNGIGNGHGYSTLGRTVKHFETISTQQANKGKNSQIKSAKINNNGHCNGTFSLPNNTKTGHLTKHDSRIMSDEEEKCRDLKASLERQKTYEELERALRLLADDFQPLVARSTPKNYDYRNSLGESNSIKSSSEDSRNNFDQKSMQHCIFEQPVYDNMIENSLKTVQMLKDNLDCLVIQVQRRHENDVSSQKSLN